MDTQVRIGALGRIKFAQGIYAYVGSAQKGLEKRIARHFSCSKEKSIHWHIDYLLASRHAELAGVLFKKAGKEEECRLAGELGKVGAMVPGFGCSDCRCASHLFRLKI